MNTSQLYMTLPDIDVEELTMLQRVTATLTEAQQQYFFDMYSGKRKNPEDVRLYCLLGIVIPGIQRFMLNQAGWGVAYFFTGGFFLVMTVIDIIDYKELALEFNTEMAYESFQMTKMSSNK